MKEDRLSQTVEFCKLIDREKFVQRRTCLSDGASRKTILCHGVTRKREQERG